MLTLTLMALVAGYAWFYYTDRRNTVTATKTIVGTVGHSIKSSLSIAKAEADITKVGNEIADTETDRLDRFADRNAKRIVDELLEDIGAGKEFRASQVTRLQEAKDRLVEAKAKANRS